MGVQERLRLIRKALAVPFRSPQDENQKYLLAKMLSLLFGFSKGLAVNGCASVFYFSHFFHLISVLHPRSVSQSLRGQRESGFTTSHIKSESHIQYTLPKGNHWFAHHGSCGISELAWTARPFFDPVVCALALTYRDHSLWSRLIPEVFASFGKMTTDEHIPVLHASCWEQVEKT